MTLAKYEQKTEYTLYPDPDQIFIDVYTIIPELARLIDQADFSTIYNFVQEFFRLKNQYRIIAALVQLYDYYEANFIKYGRETLGYLLANCLVTIWNNDVERRFLDLCMNFYYGLDKQMLRSAYRPVQATQQYRFLYVANNYVDVNASAFLILILLKYNGVQDMAYFLQRGYSRPGQSSGLQASVVRASQVNASYNDGAAVSNVFPRSPATYPGTQAVNQDQLKSQIIYYLQSRFSGVYSAQAVDQQGALAEIERLKEEQALLVTNANDKINRYKAKVEKYRNVENELNKKIAEVGAYNYIAYYRIEHLTREIYEKELAVKEVKSRFYQMYETEYESRLYIAALTDEKTRAQSGLNAELEKNKLLYKHYERLQSDVYELKRSLSEATMEAACVAYLRQKLTDMNLENADLVTRYNKIVTQIQNSQGLIATLERERYQFEYEAHTWREKAKIAEMDHDELTTGRQELRYAKTRLEEAAQQITRLKALASTQDFYAEVQYKSAELQQKLTENLQLREKIAVLEATLEGKTRQLAEQTQTHESELNRLRAQMYLAAEQIAYAYQQGTQITTLKTVSAYQKQQIEELNDYINRKQVQLDAKADEIGGLKIKIQDLLAEQALSTKAGDFYRIIEYLKQRVAELEYELLNAQKQSREHELKSLESFSLKDQYEKLRKEYEDKCSDIMSKYSENYNFRSYLYEKQHEIDMLAKYLESGKAQLEELNHYFEELQKMNETDNLNMDSAMYFDQYLSYKDALIGELSAVTEQYREYAHYLKKQLDDTVPKAREAQLLDEIALLREQLGQSGPDLRRAGSGSATTQATENLNDMQIEALTRENADLQAQLALLNTQRSMGLDASSAGCFRCQQLNAQLAAKDRRIADLEDELDRVTQDLDMVQYIKVKDLEREIQELRYQKSIDGSESIKYNLRSLLEEIDNMYKTDQLEASQGFYNFMLERVKQRITSLIE